MYDAADEFPITAERVWPPNVTFGGATRVLSPIGRAVASLRSLNNEPHRSWAEIRGRQYLANSIALSLSPYLFNSCVFGVDFPNGRTNEPEIKPTRV